MAHVITQLQLVAFAVLAFVLARRFGYLPTETRSVVLDSDWLYRRVLARVIGGLAQGMSIAWAGGVRFQEAWLNRVILRLYRSHGPASRMAQSWPTGAMVQWVAILLAVMLFVTFLA